MRPLTAEQHSTLSRDGTKVGYLRQGTGPAVVLVQGAMADVHAYRRLAEQLSDTLTVIRLERRGRGISPRRYTQEHDIARDVEDLDAVMEATGASALFGLSSGAVIALEAARTLPRVERVAVFEPPFYENGIDWTRLRQLFDDIEHRRRGAALLGALTTAGTAPPFVARLPRWAARSIGRVVLTVQAWAPGPASSLRDLLPGVRYDFHDVAQVDGHITSFASIALPVLIIRGTSSPRFLHDAAGALQQLLPEATLIELDGLGHDGPWNNGDPRAVATALTQFLCAPPAPKDGDTR
jgi:pimeloyl-ACP methyl ester carboxylesterase